MQRTVLAFGELLWDLLPSGPALGGAPFNFVYRVNSLGDRGLMVSRLGRDELGERAWAQLQSLGMDGRLIQWDDDAPTGTVQVDLSDPNRPDFHIVPAVAYDRIEATPELLEAATEADCICFGTLIQRTPTARRTLEAVLDVAPDALKLLDINLRKDCFTRETIVSSLRAADILKLNDDEACDLSSMFGVGRARVSGLLRADDVPVGPDPLRGDARRARRLRGLGRGRARPRPRLQGRAGGHLRQRRRLHRRLHPPPAARRAAGRVLQSWATPSAPWWRPRRERPGTSPPSG